MTAHALAGAQGRQIAGAASVLLVLCVVFWRMIRGIAGRAVATRMVLIAFTASVLMWAVLFELVRLLVWAVLG